jgi:RNA polymerase sigma-70 factor (ECF subfamily)
VIWVGYADGNRAARALYRGLGFSEVGLDEPVWFQGRAAVRTLLAGTILSGDARERWKLQPIHANGQPGFAFYRLDEATYKYYPFALQVLSIDHGLVEMATTFGFPALFNYFDLPSVL